MKKQRNQSKERRIRVGPRDLVWRIEPHGVRHTYNLDTTEAITEEQIYGLLALSKELNDAALSMLRARDRALEETSRQMES